MSESWGYCPHNGPDKWAELGFPLAANGTRQSPIDINTCSARQEADSMFPLLCKYVPKNSKTVENTGHSIKVGVVGEGSSLAGGPLGSDKYELLQFHFHWGSNNGQGSEHTVNGHQYPAEMHLVHWNRTKYKSPEEAAKAPKGLAVLAVLIDVDTQPAFSRPSYQTSCDSPTTSQHPEFQKIAKHIPDLRFKGQRACFTRPIDPGAFLPSIYRQFWTYEGSLTTPPLTESVTWIVFQQPIAFSNEQLVSLRQMLVYGKGESPEDGECVPALEDNFRPTQPLNGRTVVEG